MADPQVPTSSRRPNYAQVVPRGGIPRDVNKAAPPVGPLDTNFLDVIRGAPQFTALADGNGHNNTLQFTHFLKRDETLNTLQAAGTKHIFLERPPEMQKHVDDLANGKISRQEFIERMDDFKIFGVKNDAEARQAHGNTADMILGAKQRGIKVHFVDNNNVAKLDLKDPELKQYERDVFKHVEKQMAANPREYKNLSYEQQAEAGKKLAGEYYDSLPESRKERLQQLLIKERLANDGETAKDMKKIAGNERAVIFYGPQHFEGFEKEIGKENMRKILMAGRNTDPRDAAPEGWTRFNVPDKQASTPSIKSPAM